MDLFRTATNERYYKTILLIIELILFVLVITYFFACCQDIVFGKSIKELRSM